jgi:hypothetical protein
MFECSWSGQVREEKVIWAWWGRRKWVNRGACVHACNNSNRSWHFDVNWSAIIAECTFVLVHNPALQRNPKTKLEVQHLLPSAIATKTESLGDPRATSLETPNGAERVHPGQSQGAERPEPVVSCCTNSFPFRSQRAVFARLCRRFIGCCFPHKQCYEESLEVIFRVCPKQMFSCKQWWCIIYLS